MNRDSVFLGKKAWEGEQRSKVSIYCDKVEPQAKFISSRLSFRILKNKDSLKNSQALLFRWIGLFCFVPLPSAPSPCPRPSESKKYWLASSTGIAKECTAKSITMKNFFLWGGMLVTYEVSRMTECLGIIMLFIVQSSWWDLLYSVFSPIKSIPGEASMKNMVHWAL